MPAKLKSLLPEKKKKEEEKEKREKKIQVVSKDYYFTLNFLMSYFSVTF